MGATKMQILLCEDDAETSELFHNLLQDKGYEVISASCGYEALKILEAQEVDAVVTDYCMPQGDGGMLAHYCNDKNVSCFVITGQEPEMVEAYVPKGVHVLAKMRFMEVVDAGNFYLFPAAEVL